MTEQVRCPICNDADGAGCTRADLPDMKWLYTCSQCGKFSGQNIDMAALRVPQFTTYKRAALSHFVRRQFDATSKPVRLEGKALDEFIAHGTLPEPPEQADNLIRLIGRHEATTAETLDGFPPDIAALIGSLNRSQAARIGLQLLDADIIEVRDRKQTREAREFARCALTSKGWERYRELTRVGSKGSYGFVALEFANEALKTLLSEHVAPAIKSRLNFDLVDMRAAARAGVIDNIMRERIRDSAFVLADLSDDNSGAYWEGGYAEGIGKSVIYICEEAKFDEQQSHFDTNHSTTVKWNSAKPEVFVEELIATIRRSLNLFEPA